ncbi:MAG: hypothetical protein NT145_04785, partial [Elusimicrobia bacterium]|nr:hypothetical protein [Elusimicrobiota bacterium]
MGQKVPDLSRYNLKAKLSEDLMKNYFTVMFQTFLVEFWEYDSNIRTENKKSIEVYFGAWETFLKQFVSDENTKEFGAKNPIVLAAFIKAARSAEDGLKSKWNIPYLIPLLSKQEAARRIHERILFGQVPIPAGGTKIETLLDRLNKIHEREEAQLFNTIPSRSIRGALASKLDKKYEELALKFKGIYEAQKKYDARKNMQFPNALLYTFFSETDKDGDTFFTVTDESRFEYMLQFVATQSDYLGTSNRDAMIETLKDLLVECFRRYLTNLTRTENPQTVKYNIEKHLFKFDAILGKALRDCEGSFTIDQQHRNTWNVCNEALNKFVGDLWYRRSDFSFAAAEPAETTQESVTAIKERKIIVLKNFISDKIVSAVKKIMSSKNKRILPVVLEATRPTTIPTRATVPPAVVPQPVKEEANLGALLNTMNSAADVQTALINGFIEALAERNISASFADGKFVVNGPVPDSTLVGSALVDVLLAASKSKWADPYQISPKVLQEFLEKVFEMVAENISSARTDQKKKYLKQLKDICYRVVTSKKFDGRDSVHISFISAAQEGLTDWITKIFNLGTISKLESGFNVFVLKVKVMMFLREKLGRYEEFLNWFEPLVKKYDLQGILDTETKPENIPDALVLVFHRALAMRGVPVKDGKSGTFEGDGELVGLALADTLKAASASKWANTDNLSPEVLQKFLAKIFESDSKNITKINPVNIFDAQVNYLKQLKMVWLYVAANLGKAIEIKRVYESFISAAQKGLSEWVIKSFNLTAIPNHKDLVGMRVSTFLIPSATDALISWIESKKQELIGSSAVPAPKPDVLSTSVKTVMEAIGKFTSPDLGVIKLAKGIAEKLHKELKGNKGWKETVFNQKLKDFRSEYKLDEIEGFSQIVSDGNLELFAIYATLYLAPELEKDLFAKAEGDNLERYIGDHPGIYKDWLKYKILGARKSRMGATPLMHKLLNMDYWFGWSNVLLTANGRAVETPKKFQDMEAKEIGKTLLDQYREFLVNRGADVTLKNAIDDAILAEALLDLLKWISETYEDSSSSELIVKILEYFITIFPMSYLVKSSNYSNMDERFKDCLTEFQNVTDKVIESGSKISGNDRYAIVLDAFKTVSQNVYEFLEKNQIEEATERLIPTSYGKVQPEKISRAPILETPLTKIESLKLKLQNMALGMEKRNHKIAVFFYVLWERIKAYKILGMVKKTTLQMVDDSQVALNLTNEFIDILSGYLQKEQASFTVKKDILLDFNGKLVAGQKLIANVKYSKSFTNAINEFLDRLGDSNYANWPPERLEELLKNVLKNLSDFDNGKSSYFFETKGKKELAKKHVPYLEKTKELQRKIEKERILLKKLNPFVYRIYLFFHKFFFFKEIKDVHGEGINHIKVIKAFNKVMGEPEDLTIVPETVSQTISSTPAAPPKTEEEQYRDTLLNTMNSATDVQTALINGFIAALAERSNISASFADGKFVINGPVPDSKLLGLALADVLKSVSSPKSKWVENVNRDTQDTFIKALKEFLLEIFEMVVKDDISGAQPDQKFVYLNQLKNICQGALAELKKDTRQYNVIERKFFNASMYSLTDWVINAFNLSKISKSEVNFSELILNGRIMSFLGEIETSRDPQVVGPFENWFMSIFNKYDLLLIINSEKNPDNIPDTLILAFHRALAKKGINVKDGISGTFEGDIELVGSALVDVLKAAGSAATASSPEALKEFLVKIFKYDSSNITETDPGRKFDAQIDYLKHLKKVWLFVVNNMKGIKLGEASKNFPFAARDGLTNWVLESFDIAAIPNCEAFVKLHATGFLITAASEKDALISWLETKKQELIDSSAVPVPKTTKATWDYVKEILIRFVVKRENAKEINIILDGGYGVIPKTLYQLIEKALKMAFPEMGINLYFDTVQVALLSIRSILNTQENLIQMIENLAQNKFLDDQVAKLIEIIARVLIAPDYENKLLGGLDEDFNKWVEGHPEKDQAKVRARGLQMKDEAQQESPEAWLQTLAALHENDNIEFLKKREELSNKIKEAGEKLSKLLKDANNIKALFGVEAQERSKKLKALKNESLILTVAINGYKDELAKLVSLTTSEGSREENGDELTAALK